MYCTLRFNTNSFVIGQCCCRIVGNCQYLERDQICNEHVVRLITYITVDSNNATQAHKRTIVSLLDSFVAKLLQIAKIWSAIKFVTIMWFD